MLKTYIVTIEFIGGTLEGIVMTDEWPRRSERPEVGWVCRKPLGGSPYKIVAVIEK